jgi:hypothetical protein
MKSLLVDALRQANSAKSRKALSDSGSFSVACDDFQRTANDAGDPEDFAAGVAQDRELELLDAAGDPEDPQAPALEAARSEPRKQSDSELRESNRASHKTIARSQSHGSTAPLLARYSPLLCLSLAVIAASFWAVVANLETRGSSRALGAVVTASRPSILPTQPAESSTLQRFPFITDAMPSSRAEAAE